MRVYANTRGTVGSALLGGAKASSSAAFSSFHASTSHGASLQFDAAAPAGETPGGRTLVSRSRRALAHAFGPRLSTLIGRLGQLAAERPLAVLAACLGAIVLCAGLLASDVIEFKVETDSARLWLPPGVAASTARYVGDFETPAYADAGVHARNSVTMPYLPQIAEAMRLNETLRTTRKPEKARGDGFERLPPSPAFTSAALSRYHRRGTTARGGSRGRDGNYEDVAATPVVKGALGGLDEFLGCVSLDAELSAMSWRDLLLALCWLPVRVQPQRMGEGIRCVETAPCAEPPSARPSSPTFPFRRCWRWGCPSTSRVRTPSPPLRRSVCSRSSC
jgi:hypothetical protein